MAQKPGQPTASNLRALNRELANAPDAQLARVVAVVDAMPQRGPADALIASFRPRLARMRPTRPLRFTRLLFWPLDPLIVPAPRWRPGLPTVPRSVLQALSSTVRVRLGAEAAAIDAAIVGRAMHDRTVIAEAGARLWPLAADILSQAPPPVGWTDTGLNEIVYPPLARRIGLLLAQLPMLHELVAEAEAGILPPRLEPVAAILATVARQSADAIPAMLTVLLAWLPQAIALLPTIAPRLGPLGQHLLQQAAEQATEVLLQRMDGATGADPPLAVATLSEAAGEVRRAATLLREFDAMVVAPERRQRLQSIRSRLDAACRAQFSHGLAVEFLEPLRELAATADDAAPARLETAARQLRELETEARAIGGGDSYDTLLRQATAAVTGGASALNLADRVRLVEILSGPEAALAFLEADAKRDAGVSSMARSGALSSTDTSLRR